MTSTSIQDVISARGGYTLGECADGAGVPRSHLRTATPEECSRMLAWIDASPTRARPQNLITDAQMRREMRGR